MWCGVWDGDKKKGGKRGMGKRRMWDLVPVREKQES